VNSNLYQEPDDEAGAMKVPDFEMKGKTGVFPVPLIEQRGKDSWLSISRVLFHDRDRKTIYIMLSAIPKTQYKGAPLR
jgi:hypothetical protein